MSKTHLPKQIDPIRLADRGAHLKGTFALESMSRLSAMLFQAQGNVSVDLVFGIDAQGMRFIQGTTSAVVELVCQRCLQPYAYTLTGKVHLSPVKDDEAAALLPEDYEPIILSETSEVALDELVEDELILNVPLVAMHEPSACSVKMISDKPEIAKPNAFEVLKSLKKDFGKE